MLDKQEVKISNQQEGVGDWGGGKLFLGQWWLYDLSFYYFISILNLELPNISK